MKIIPNIQLDSNKFPWPLGLILYLISYGGGILYLGAIYWDDWTLFNVPPVIILDAFKQAGTIFSWPGHLHIFLLKSGPEIYRILTFVLMFMSGYLLWRILSLVDVLNQLERNLITVFFLVLPLNAARIALIDFPYTLCYFSFFLAWYLLVSRSNQIFKVFSLLLFLFSFNTNSLLAFYLLPVVHAIYLSARGDLKKSIMWGSRHIFFLLAPFVWFFIKTKYFPPYGLYVAYNSLHYGKLLLTLLLGLPLLISFLVWGIRKHQGKSIPIDRGIALLFTGLAITWLGVFPYLTVGAWPLFNDWSSRHQLLMPLGVAVSLVGFGSWISYGNTLRISVFLLWICALVNLHTSFEYHVDWIKQSEVLQLLSQSSEIRGAKTILFDDKTDHFNAKGRKYRFYEYNGWFKLIYGNQARWGMNEVDWIGPLTGILNVDYHKYITQHYSAGEYIAAKPDIIATLKARRGRLGTVLHGSGDFALDITTLKDGIYTSSPPR